MRAMVLLGLFFGATGCRITDPFYYGRDVRAEAPPAPGYALLFGAVEVADLFGGEVNQVTVRRVAPEPAPRFWGVSENLIYRGLRPRHMGGGYFAMVVPPGVYEIEAFSSGGACATPATWHATEPVRVATRFYVTRPGVYDLGRLVLRSGGAFEAASMEWVPGDSKDHAAVLREAVTGTHWEGYLEAEK